MTRIATFDVADLRDHGETGAFRRLLHADPEAAFAHFATLYHSHTIDRPVTENVALCGAADAISLDILSVCYAETDGRIYWAGHAGNVKDPDGIGEDLWECIMASDLPMVLVEIVSDPSFYQEEDRWIFSILNCLAGLLKYWSDEAEPDVEFGTLQKSRTHRFIVATVPMWETVWKCQSQLVFSMSENDSDLKVLWPFTMLSTMTLGMNGLYRGTKHFREAMLSKLPHVALFAWYHLPIHGPADNRAIEVVAAHCHGSLHLGREGTKPDMLLFRDDFLHGPGEPILVLKKLIHLIQTADWMIDNELGVCLNVLANLISADYELLAVYHGIPALALVTHALKKQRKSGDRDYDSWAWMNGARNMDVVGEHLVKQLCPPKAVRGRDAFYIFASGISIFVPELESGEPENPEHSGVIVDTFNYWCKVIHLAVEGSDGGFPPETVADLKAAAPTRWYPTMKKLRDAQVPLRKRVVYRKLVDSWQMIGKDLGVDEKAEGKRFEKDKKDITKLCSWTQCEYHSSPAPDDVAIKQCKGCGEARYCSRECQTTHWKKGHKVDCRRLKV
ncbi:hypothetical protein PENSPDRAFT_693269 [Peniophora sp. CONT]|nr:hypothetical protein PENSPDRAFT_693269 [Peniophora sp. CONT]